MTNVIKEEKMKIYKLYKIIINLKESRNTQILKPATPIRLKKNSSFFNTKEANIENNENRLIFGDLRRSISRKHDFHNTSLMKFQEKLDESGSQSNKDVQNSIYNDFSEDKMEAYDHNPLEIAHFFSNQNENKDKFKEFLEKIKEKNSKKYVFYNKIIFFNYFDFFLLGFFEQ